MASVTALRDGLAARLNSIAELTGHARAPGSINTPAAVVTPAPNFLAFDATMGRGSDTFAFIVLVLASRADEELGQELLDAYLDGDGEQSIKAAIEADGTLGGVAHYAVVSRAQAYGEHEYGGVSYVGCELLVEVNA